MEKGTELKVLETGKTIKVVNFKETDLGLVIIGDDGEIYTEDQLDIRYRLTPERLLFQAVLDANIFEEEDMYWDFKLWHIAFDNFMHSMIKAEYIKDNK